MKRIGHIIDHITMETIRCEAFKALAARRGKSRAAAAFCDNIETLGADLLSDLKNGTWWPSPVRTRTLIERGKTRLLEIPAFRDVVAQRAMLAGRLGRALLNHTERNSFSSIPGRGPLKAAKTVARIVARGRSARWCLYFDVKKYYAHIDTERLRMQMRDIVKDRTALVLIDRVLMMGEKGLPIGNTASHMFANLYLTPIAAAARRMPGVTDLCIYMDNVHIFGPSKRKLHAARRALAELMAERGLTMKEDWQVFRTDVRAVDCCGFRIMAGRPWRVRRNIVRHLRSSLKTFRTARRGTKECRHAAASALSLQGWISCAGSRAFYTANIRPMFRKLKNEVKHK